MWPKVTAKRDPYWLQRIPLERKNDYRELSLSEKWAKLFVKRKKGEACDRGKTKD